MARNGTALLLLILITLLPGAGGAQQGPQKVATSLNDMSWIAGHWFGEIRGQQLEEVWTQPRAGLMQGMIRVSSTEQTSLLEILTLRETPEGVEIRVRQFDSSLTPLQTGDPLTLRLASHDGMSFAFDNTAPGAPTRVTYVVTSEDSFTTRVEIPRPDAETLIVEFHLQRAK